MSNVRLQNLRDCTVQIRRPSDNAIIGTGIAVTMDGKLVTCAHVVQAALNVHPRDANGAEIGVYFPQVRGNERKDRHAKIAGCFPQHDDDVVLLQLLDGPAPLAPEQIAVLGKAEDSCDHPFRSYGYRRLDKYLAGWADGKIHGCVEVSEGVNVQAEPVQLASSQINGGMSGAAVLDVERNLIVGIVAETWFPDLSTKDRDTAWAVNARVLGFAPLGLLLQDESLPKHAAPQPKTDLDEARQTVAPKVGIVWNDAPPPLQEWIGRADLLNALTADWQSQTCRITGLIGFGGEGKSSLARQWMEMITHPLPPLFCEERGKTAINLLSSSLFQREEAGGELPGVFWWGFYTKPNVEEFFEAALSYLSGGKIDRQKYPSTNAKVHFIAGMLYEKRCIFVLDGLEILQYQGGDQYGLLRSGDLREFLSYFADPQQQSFCVITSRAPVLDLMAYTTYTHRDVTRLSANDGRDLLRKIGVKGDDQSLHKIVADWDGHALTLSLLGSYLVERHNGTAANIGAIPPPLAREERYDRVHRVLRRYDEHLTEAERAFMTIFSAFRMPVAESAFDKVFRIRSINESRHEKKLKPSFWEKLGFSKKKSPANIVTNNCSPLHAPIAALNDAEFAAMLQRLCAYRILHYDSGAQHYTTHPLIRHHYFGQLTAGDHAHVQDIHNTIKAYYLKLAGKPLRFPTLNDLIPLIEAVHHACLAGVYDEAHRIRRDRIYQDKRRVLTEQLGAYETTLALMQEFFPDGDTSQEPQVSEPKDKSWILNTVGFCLMNLGRLSEAVSFYKRANLEILSMQDLYNASIGYQNLSELYAHLGALTASAEAAQRAFTLARYDEIEQNENRSLVCQAWTAYLCGELKTTDTLFRQVERRVERLKLKDTSETRPLCGLSGIQHANYLRRTGDPGYSRRVTEMNLKICEKYRWPDTLSQCYRVLGDLEADVGQHDKAGEHYAAALKIAREISVRAALIEALLARGRWQARWLHDPAAAFNDLHEAFEYAESGGYRIYEADIRIALAWAHLATLTPEENLTPGPSPKRKGEETARAEATRALQMSAEMGYYWGKVDAEEVLARLK